MPLAGPRLDRPSAIGDEGRSRTTSLWIASAIVLALTGLGGYLVGQASLLPTLGTIVGGLVAGIGLLERERFVHLFFGHVTFVLFGSVVVCVLLFAPIFADFGFAISSLAVAMLGIGVAWANVDASDGLKRTLVGTVIAYVSMVASLVLLLFGASVLFFGWALVTPAGTLSAVGALSAFLVAVGYAAGSLRLAQWQLPIVQLLSRSRRDAVRDRLRTVGWVTLGTTIASPIALVVVVGCWLAGLFDGIAAVAPPVATALSLLGHVAVLGIFGVVGTIALVATLAAVLLRLATRQLGRVTVRVIAAGAAGVFLAVLLVTAILFVSVVPSVNVILTSLILFGATMVAPVVLIVSIPVLLGGVAVGILPDRAGGPALAATGLILAAIGFGRAPPVLVYGCVAGGVVVWDLSTFGLGLTGEVGHLPDTRRIELFHGVIVVAIGILAVLALGALDLLRTAVFGPIGGSIALFVAGLGVVFLLSTLRG